MNLEIYHGLRWTNREELSSLLRNQIEIEGPLEPQRIERTGLIRSGLTLCYREARRISREKKYDFAIAQGATEIGKRGYVDVEFYKFVME